MKHTEMKKKVLSMIEELNPDSELLTDDPDIAAKYNEVTNQVMFELARSKKIPKYTEMSVEAGELVDFDALSNAVGYEVYQLLQAGGVRYTSKANGTVLKVLESGTLEVEVYVYPDRITEQNAANYEFELTQDVLEIMPYGIAADLLKSDVSAEYGSVYATRYESMLQRLDPRYQMSSIYIEGGVDV